MPTLHRLADGMNTWLDRLTGAASLLVLPLAVLLFAQWPLRDVVGAGSRPANDMAQWIFALYVAVALRHTTRECGHMATDAVAARYSPLWRRRIARWGQPLCVLPWALFVLVSGAPSAWQSLRQLESFPDTLNPLYFVIKGSVWLLALLVALQSLADGVAGANGRTE
jgi:TRAP-type mannitol/chloroaromatic compound transport system permease small subunit